MNCPPVKTPRVMMAVRSAMLLAEYHFTLTVEGNFLFSEQYSTAKTTRRAKAT